MSLRTIISRSRCGALLASMFSILNIILLPMKMSADEPFNFRHSRIVHYNNENGLPQNTITSMAYDDQNYLWIGTEGGLVRFNGYSFEDKSSFISNPRVRVILKSLNSDTLWIIDQNESLYYVDQQTRNPVRYNDYLRNHYCFVKEKIFGKPLSENDRCDEVYHFLLPYLFHITSDSSIYSNRDDGTLIWINNQLKELDVSDLLSRILVLEDCIIFLDNQRKAKFYCNGSYAGVPNIIFEGIAVNKDAFLDRGYFFKSGMKNYAILEDALYELTKKDNDIIVRRRMSGLPNMFSISYAHFNKSTGVLVVGSKTDGFYVIEESGFNVRMVEAGKFRTYTLSGDVNNLASQLEIDDGKVLANNGYIYNGGDISKSGIADMYAYLLFKDAYKRIWLSDNSGTLNIYDSTLNLKTQFPIKEFVLHMAEEKPGRYWAVTNYAVLEFECNRNTCKLVRRVPGNLSLPFISLHIKDKNTIWLNTRKGVYSMNKQSGKIRREDVFGELYVRNFSRSNSGNIWVGTYGNGFFLHRGDSLIPMPPDSKKYLSYTHSFEPDAKGFLWISTNNGLFQVLENDLIDYANGLTEQVYYHYYDRSYGFATNEFNGGGSNSSLKVADGRFSFVSMNGLVQFYPERVKPLLPSNPLMIDKVFTDDTLLLPPYKKILLRPDFRRMAVLMNTIFFGHPDNLKIEYRINGLDMQWQPVPPNRIINIPTIHKGNYTLEIRKLNGFGRNNFETITLDFEVLPHFYERPIFIILVVLFLLLLTGSTLLLRIKILNNINEQLKIKVQERTDDLQKAFDELQEKQTTLMEKQEALNTVMQVVMHDLTSPLRFLSRLSRRVKDDYKKLSTDEIDSSLNLIHVSSSQAEQFTKDLLTWMKSKEQQVSFEKQWISPDELIRQNILLYKWIADDKGIKIEHIEQTDKRTVLLAPDLLGIILRNLMDNAVKYTNKGSVTIQCRYSNESLIISIADTGMGLDEAIVRKINNWEIPYQLEQDKHLGFRLIFDAIKYIEAKLTIHSIKGKGTTVEVILPI